MEDPIQKHNDFVNEVMKNKLLQGKPGTIYIPELLAKLCEFSKREEKIRVLHANSTPALQMLIKLCYYPGIEWDFTRKDLDGLQIVGKMEVPDYDMSPTTLFRTAMKLEMFTQLKKTGNRMSKEKALKVIGEWFSAMHPNDIDIIKQVVDGKFRYKGGITEKLAREAFPNLIPPAIEKEEEPVSSLPFVDGGDSDDEDESSADSKLPDVETITTWDSEDGKTPDMETITPFKKDSK